MKNTRIQYGHINGGQFVSEIATDSEIYLDGRLGHDSAREYAVAGRKRLTNVKSEKWGTHARIVRTSYSVDMGRDGETISLSPVWPVL